MQEASCSGNPLAQRSACAAPWEGSSAAVPCRLTCSLHALSLSVNSLQRSRQDRDFEQTQLGGHLSGHQFCDGER